MLKNGKLFQELYVSLATKATFTASGNTGTNLDLCIFMTSRSSNDLFILSVSGWR